MQIHELAVEYFKVYKEQGGNQGKEKMLNDLKIVARASLYKCDLLFTEDKRTMQHPSAQKAYGLVNVREGLRTPTFHGYNELKQRYN